MKNRELNPYYGATVGRVAGRIAGATFTIKGDLIPQREEEKKEGEEEKKEEAEEKKEGEEEKKEGEEEKQIEEKEKPRHPDEVYPLAANNGPNCLHGGVSAYD